MEDESLVLLTFDLPSQTMDPPSPLTDPPPWNLKLKHPLSSSIIISSSVMFWTTL